MKNEKCKNSKRELRRFYVNNFCTTIYLLLCHSLVRLVILFTIDHSQKEKQTFRFM